MAGRGTERLGTRVNHDRSSRIDSRLINASRGKWLFSLRFAKFPYFMGSIVSIHVGNITMSRTAVQQPPSLPLSFVITSKNYFQYLFSKTEQARLDSRIFFSLKKKKERRKRLNHDKSLKEKKMNRIIIGPELKLCRKDEYCVKRKAGELMQIDVSARYRLHPVPLSFLSSPFAFPAHDAQFSLIQGQSIAKPRSFGLFVIQPTTKHISYWFASSRHSCLCISPIQDKPLSLSLSLPCLLFTSLIPDTKRISGASPSSLSSLFPNYLRPPT